MRRLRFRYSLKALLVITTMLAIGLASCVVTSRDHVTIARSVVARFVNGQSLLGPAEMHLDQTNISEVVRFSVVCDFLRAGESLSADPRVQHIKSGEYDALFKQYGFDDTQYLFIELTSTSVFSARFSVTRSYDVLAAEGFSLEFRKFLFILRHSGSLEWMS